MSLQVWEVDGEGFEREIAVVRGVLMKTEPCEGVPPLECGKGLQRKHAPHYEGYYRTMRCSCGKTVWYIPLPEELEEE